MNKNRFSTTRYNYTPKFNFKPNPNFMDENELALSPEDLDFRDYEDDNYERLDEK